MFFPTVAVVAALASTAQAHFRLNAPLPRGPYVADQQTTFCSGYTEVTSNRTTFPLEGGSFTIETGHGNWTAAVLISTAANPNTFDAFKAEGEDVYVREFTAREANGGTFCLPLDLASQNIPGVADGANVTLQVVFEGGDGLLYQCADLTLSSTATPGACTNATSPAHNHEDDADGDDDHDHDDHEGHDHDDEDAHDHDDEEGSSLQVAKVSGIAAAAMGLLALASSL